MNIIRRRGWEIPERLGHARTPGVQPPPSACGRRWRGRAGADAAARRRAAQVGRRQDGRSDRRSLSGQAQRHVQARPAGDRREDQRRLQQLLRIRHLQAHRRRRAGAADPAVDGEDRRAGGEEAGDRHRRSHPQDDAGRAALPPPLRRGLEHGDRLDRLSVRQAGGFRQAPGLGQVRADDDLHGPVGRRSASTWPGSPGRT